MGFYSKTDRQVENIYKQAEKERDYSTKRKAERAMEERGYEYGGFSGWTKKKKEPEYISDSEPLGTVSYPGQGILLMLVPFIAPLLMNPFIAVIYAFLVPLVAAIFINNKILKDIVSLIPLSLFWGVWSLALLPLALIPGKLKNLYNVHAFSFIFSGYVLITNIIRWNELRIKKDLSIMSGIFKYDWRLMMQHADNALVYSIILYAVFVLFKLMTGKKTMQN